MFLLYCRWVKFYRFASEQFQVHQATEKYDFKNFKMWSLNMFKNLKIPKIRIRINSLLLGESLCIS